MANTITYYEVVIRTTERRIANEVKKRVSRYDMNKEAEIRVIYEDKPRCPACQRVLRKEELAFQEVGGQPYCLCGELIDFDI